MCSLVPCMTLDSSGSRMTAYGLDDWCLTPSRVRKISFPDWLWGPSSSYSVGTGVKDRMWRCIAAVFPVVLATFIGSILWRVEFWSMKGVKYEATSCISLVCHYVHGCRTHLQWAYPYLLPFHGCLWLVGKLHM